MRFILGTGLAAMALGALAKPARADMTVYYHVGSWDAFSGQGSDGKPVCGVGSTNPGDNRSFSERFPIGGESVAFEVKKPTWSIPGGTQLPVVVQVGLSAPWNFQAIGNGQAVDWSLDRGAMQTFDSQFRLATSMTVSFPTGNEPPWTVGLSGSTAISNAFGRCVTDLTQRTAGSRQTTGGPTQPFGLSTMPIRPALQAPAQPTQPTPSR